MPRERGTTGRISGQFMLLYVVAFATTTTAITRYNTFLTNVGYIDYPKYH